MQTCQCVPLKYCFSSSRRVGYLNMSEVSKTDSLGLLVCIGRLRNVPTSPIIYVAFLLAISFFDLCKPQIAKILIIA